MDNIPKRRIYKSAQEIPYINYVPNDGRKVVLSGYYDCERQQFYTHMLVPDGTVVALPALDMLEGTYIARAPANERLDCRLPLLETTINHFSFGDMLSVLRDAERDLVNGLASLHKYFVLLHHVNDHKDHSGNLLISTEVEYAFGNHRSFYDLLHKMISIIQRYYQEKAPELPDSFAKIAAKDVRELMDKYALPGPSIDFYKDRENVFLQLRDIRDNIFHHGHSPDSSYTFPDGFAVRVEDRLAKRLANLNLWPEHLLRKNQLGSILAILAFLVNDMFDAMDGLQASLLACFEVLPPPTISGHMVFCDPLYRFILYLSVNTDESIGLTLRKFSIHRSIKCKCSNAAQPTLQATPLRGLVSVSGATLFGATLARLNGQKNARSRTNLNSFQPRQCDRQGY